MGKIFISYARDDSEIAATIYRDLKASGFDPWLDTEDLLAGQDWEQIVRRTIKECSFFMALISKNSVNRRGFVQKELRQALEVLDTAPPGHIFVIPVRLDETEPLHEKLNRLQWVDLFESYPKSFDKIIRAVTSPDNEVRAIGHTENLRRPEPPLREIKAVPSLPRTFLARPQLMRRVKDTLLGDLQEPLVVSGPAATAEDQGDAAQVVGIQGMGGIGKSILAAAVARDRDVRRAYPDGVVWVSVARKPNFPALMRKFAAHLGCDNAFRTVAEGKGVLQEFCAQKAVLLVLDDVWNARDVEAFDILGPRCKMLITTRDAGILRTLQGELFPVELLSLIQARELLADNARTETRALPQEEADEIVRKCGCLPLALALAGGMVAAREAHDGSADKQHAWRNVLERLRRADLDKVRDRHAINPRHENIWKAIAASVDVLRDAERKRFTELSVFLPDQRTPALAVATLWGHTGDLDDLDTDELLTELADRSLVYLDTDEDGTRRVWLHDLLYDFATRIADDPETLNHQLLAAYRAKCPTGWHTGPNDGYFLQNICSHLAAAAGNWDGPTALLTDWRFLETKCMAGLAYELQEDYAEVLRHMRSGGTASDGALAELLAFSRFFTAQLHVFSHHPELVWQQAANQPPGSPVFLATRGHPQDNAGRPWLRRVNRADAVGSDPLRLVAHSREVITCVFGSENALLTGGGDGTLRVWDTCSGRQLHTLEPPDQRPVSFRGEPADLAQCVVHFDATLERLRSASSMSQVQIDEAMRKTRPWNVSTCTTSAGFQCVVLGGIDGSLRVLDAKLRVLRTIDDSASLGPAVTACAICDDCRSSLFGDEDGTVRFVPLTDGAGDAASEAGPATVVSCGYLPDGGLVYACFVDGSTTVWSTRPWATVFTCAPDHGGLTAACYAPEATLLIAITDRQRLVAWDLACREEKYAVDLPQRKRRCSVSRDGSRLFLAGRRDVELWNGHAGIRQRAAAWSDHDINCVGCSPRGDQFALGLRDSSVEVHRRPVREPAPMPAGIYGPVKAIRFFSKQGFAARAGSRVLTGNVEQGLTRPVAEIVDGAVPHAFAVARGGRHCAYVREDCSIACIDTQDEGNAQILSGHEFAVTGMAFHPGGGLLLSVSCDSTARLWDLQEMRCLGVYEHHGPLTLCQLSPTGSHVGTFGFEGIARVWNTRSGRLCSEVTVGTRKTSHSFYNERCSEPKIGGRVSHPPNRKKYFQTEVTLEPLLKPHLPHFPFAFSPGLDLCAAVERAKLRVFDLVTGEVVATFKNDGGAIVSCVFSPDSSQVLSCDSKGTARLWSIAHPASPAQEYPLHAGRGDIVSISAEGHVAVVAGSQPDSHGTRTGRTLLGIWPFGCASTCLVYPDAAAITSLNWNGTGDCCVLGCDDGSVHVVKVEASPVENRRTASIGTVTASEYPWADTRRGGKQKADLRWSCPEDEVHALARQAQEQIDARDFPAARDALQAVIARSVEPGGTGPIELRRLIFHLGRVQLRLGDFEAAVNSHRQALGVAPLPSGSSGTGGDPMLGDSEIAYAFGAWQVSAALSDCCTPAGKHFLEALPDLASTSPSNGELSDLARILSNTARAERRDLGTAMWILRAATAGLQLRLFWQLMDALSPNGPVPLLQKEGLLARLLRQSGVLERAVAAKKLALSTAYVMRTEGCVAGRAHIENLLREVRGKKFHIFALTTAICNAQLLLSKGGAHDEAEQIAQYYVLLAQEIKNDEALAIGWHNLGCALASAGRPSEGESLIRRSMDLERKIGKERSRGNAMANLAECLVLQGRHGEAKTLLEEAAQGLEESEARWLKVLRLRSLIAESEGKYDVAETETMSLLARIEETDRPVADFQRAEDLGVTW